MRETDGGGADETDRSPISYGGHVGGCRRWSRDTVGRKGFVTEGEADSKVALSNHGVVGHRTPYGMSPSDTVRVRLPIESNFLLWSAPIARPLPISLADRISPTPMCGDTWVQTKKVALT
ncbi:hypothetical protein Q3G72_024070 [Acer saccharum]|nr:hypothetical protein Q3G72_024070 [Acer saccharum]